MGIAYITEFADVAVLQGNRVAMAMQPPIAEQAITFTSTAGTSAAFNATTKLVRICVDSIASILFSTAGTAAVLSTNARMSAGQTEYFGVPQGQGFKVSIVVTTV